MRTDVKIAIVVCLVAVCLVALWFAFAKKETTPTTPIASGSPPARAGTPGHPDAPVRPPVTPVAPVAPRPTIPPAPAPVPASPAPSPTGPVPPAPAPASPAPVGPEASHLPWLPGPSPATPAHPLTPAPGVPTGVVPTGPVSGTTTRPATLGTYTVKAGDSGFWGIAQNVYGNGKYFGLIAKANPNAFSERLHVGQVLTIPPLPAPTAGTFRQRQHRRLGRRHGPAAGQRRP